MKKFALVLAFTFPALIATAYAEDKAAEITPSKTVKLQDMAWLAGCWKVKPKETPFNNVEMWMKPSGNIMLGVGADLKGDKASAYEHMRIEAKDSGEIVFTAKPFDQPEASFTLTSESAENLVFENPQHSFPQRVIYRKQKDGSLEARIDGKRDGKMQAALFPMIKVACE
jgi:hypothetical protein